MLVTALWSLVAMGVGSLVAVQVRLNGELATVSGDPLTAAAVLFAMGLVILLLVGLTSRERRRAVPAVVAAVRDGRLRWWQVLGGVAGATFVGAQAVTSPALGVAMFMVAFVAGQTVGGLVVDGLGIGPAGRQRATGTRVAGAVLVVVSVLLSVAGELRGDVPVLLLVVPFACGLLMSAQQGVNGRVSVATTPFAATLCNFVVGIVLYAIVLAVHALTGGITADLAGSPWYAYLGGVIGLVFVAFAVVGVRHLGVLRMSLALVTGQLLGSLVLDLVWPAPGAAVTWWTVLALGLALAAVALAAVRPAPRRLPAADGPAARG